jgi:Type III restriction enzyme, res subunit
MSQGPRPGQSAALDTILSRFARGERYTAVVLPTRYGKSDVIRAAAMLGVELNLVACSLVLSPNGVLVKQLLKPDKWAKCLERFSGEWLKENNYPPISFQPKYSRLPKVKARPNANGEHLLSATIQLIERNKDVFSEWVESVRHNTGLPVAVFMDESHTGSESNRWGAALKQLASSGAQVVLLTATAERSDGKAIPGFEFDEVETEPTTVHVARPGSVPELVRVDVYEGVKRRLRLRPDHETPFSQAFDEDALAKVSHTPIDVDLSEVAGGSFTGLLSELPASRVPAALDKVVRHPEMIRLGCQELITSQRRFRNTIPGTLAIVYCGNDDQRHGASRGDNQHPELVKAELRRQAPDLRSMIFTSDSEDAEDELIAFCEGGNADIAIVKQMAGLGLDSELLKVGLDLSTVRTYGASVQRMMRVATPPPLVSHWISPADILARASFQRLVKDEGGEAKAAELTLIESYEVERKEEKVKEVWRVGTVMPGDFDDSQEYRGTKDEYPVVQQFLTSFPALRSEYTDAYIAHHLRTFRLEQPGDDGKIVAQDTGAQADALRIEINQVGDDATKALYAHHGRPWGTWGNLRKEVFGEAYGAAGWPHGTELSQLDDLRLLHAVRDAMQQVHARILGLGGDS